MEPERQTDQDVSSLLLEKQDRTARLIQVLIHEVRGLHQRISELEPQTFLPAIESPPNPNNFVNVARFLREVITSRNLTIPDGGEKYFSFPDELDDHQLNTDALMCIDSLLCFHLSEHYGKKTCSEVYEKESVRCERFIQNAKHVPELAVFEQAAAQWAIRRLVENKMKSKLRTRKVRAARQASRREMQDTSQQERGVQIARKLVEDIGSGQVQNRNDASILLSDSEHGRVLQQMNPTPVPESNAMPVGVDHLMRCDIVPEVDMGYIDNGILKSPMRTQVDNGRQLRPGENQLGSTCNVPARRRNEKATQHHRVRTFGKVGLRNVSLHEDDRVRDNENRATAENREKTNRYTQNDVLERKVNLHEIRPNPTSRMKNGVANHRITPHMEAVQDNLAAVLSEEGRLMAPPAQNQSYLQNVVAARSRTVAPNVGDDTNIGVAGGREAIRGVRMSRSRGAKPTRGTSRSRDISRAQARRAAQFHALSNVRAASHENSTTKVHAMASGPAKSYVIGVARDRFEAGSNASSERKETGQVVQSNAVSQIGDISQGAAVLPASSMSQRRVERIGIAQATVKKHQLDAEITSIARPTQGSPGNDSIAAARNAAQRRGSFLQNTFLRSSAKEGIVGSSDGLRRGTVEGYNRKESAIEENTAALSNSKPIERAKQTEWVEESVVGRNERWRVLVSSNGQRISKSDA